MFNFRPPAGPSTNTEIVILQNHRRTKTETMIQSIEFRSLTNRWPKIKFQNSPPREKSRKCEFEPLKLIPLNKNFNNGSSNTFIVSGSMHKSPLIPIGSWQYERGCGRQCFTSELWFTRTWHRLRL